MNLDESKAKFPSGLNGDGNIVSEINPRGLNVLTQLPRIRVYQLDKHWFRW